MQPRLEGKHEGDDDAQGCCHLRPIPNNQRAEKRGQNGHDFGGHARRSAPQDAGYAVAHYQQQEAAIGGQEDGEVMKLGSKGGQRSIERNEGEGPDASEARPILLLLHELAFNADQRTQEERDAKPPPRLEIDQVLHALILPNTLLRDQEIVGSAPS